MSNRQAITILRDWIEDARAFGWAHRVKRMRRMLRILERA